MTAAVLTQNNNNDYLKGYLLVLISAISYGLQPLFTHFAYDDGANPVGLLLMRFGFAVAIMLGWLAFRRMTIPPLKHCIQYLLVGFGYSGAALGYYSASHTTSVSLAVILMFSFPAFVVLFSITVLKEQATIGRLISVILAIGGVIVATGLDLRGDMTGIFWALFAAVSYGSAILYGSHKASPGYPVQSACIVLIGCLTTFAISALINDAQLPQTGTGWTATAGLALFATILPIATFIAGSPRIGASNASTLSTLEPVTAVAIAVLLIGENISTAMLFGGLMVVVAAVILAKSK